MVGRGYFGRIFWKLGLLTGLVMMASPAIGRQVVDFASQMPPPALDYANPASWAAFAGKGVGATPAPGAVVAGKDQKVDVFYVHPTTLRSTDRWNGDPADATLNAWTDGSATARQASIFDGCCRLFAPRYRQASTLALMKMDGEGGKAFDLAYGDVERAFDEYIAHENHGRPFILVGHSQGGSHVARLVQRRIDGKPLQAKMVAAYAIGFNLAEGDFPLTYKTVPICRKPDQLHCLVQWNSVLPSADLDVIAKASERRFVALHGDVAGKTTLCVNPLTFDADKPTADATQSLGAVPGTPDASPMRSLEKGKVAARCDRGFLVVTPDPSLELQPLPGGSLHYHDLGLFYADVRANAALRAKAALTAHP
jgi:hypothetical protein